MERIIHVFRGCALALGLTAMAGCTPQQNPYGNSANHSGSATVGTGFSQNNAPSSSGTYTPPSPAGTVAGGTVDRSRSKALTEYLQNHHLPLVSGRVVSSGGPPQVILDGYVASEYGKSDAEQKARTYLNNPNTLVDNRITISPELAGGSNSPSNGAPDASSANDPYASAGSVQDYQNQQFDPYAAQQQQQYQQQQGYGGSSAMSPGMSLLLGLLGGSFGGGGVSMGGGGGGFGGGGFGGGGFGVGGSSGYSGYGYPTYPSAGSGVFP